MAEKGFGVKEINLIGASGTPTIESPNNLNLNAVNVAISTNVSIGGTLTVSGNLSIGGTITYEDVTNVDSVGIVTARSGLRVTGGTSNFSGASHFVGIARFNETIVGTARTALKLTCQDESTDTTTYPLFVAATTGDQFPKTGTNLSFNSANGTLTATTFSGSGASLTNLPLSNTDVQVLYTLTANGSSAYRFAGNGIVSTEDNPDVYLIRGLKYRFVNNSGGSHPFQIRESSGGSAYSAGVTNNGAASGNIDFQVPYSAPSRLYYQCTSHGGMVGNLYIRGAGGQNTNVGVTTFSGNIIGDGEIQALTKFESKSGNDLRLNAGSANRDIFLQVNDTTLMTVRGSTGNVGIGTDNPSNYGGAVKLALHNTGNSVLSIVAGTSSDSSILFADGTSGDATYRGNIKYAHDGDSMRFHTAAAERLRIDSAGRVLIGTTSGSDALVVDGGSDAGTILTNSTNSNGNMMTFQCSGTSKFFIGSAGSFITGESGVTNQGIRSVGDMVFAAGSGATERLRITSGGDIGVGIDAPVSRLQINSTRNAETDRHTAANYHLALRNPEDDTGESIGLSFGITSNATKVGAAILHERDGGGSQGSLQFYTSGDGNSLSERLRITSTGYRELRNYHYGPFAFTNDTWKSTITVGDPGDNKFTTIKLILTLIDGAYRQGMWQGEYTIFASNSVGGPGVDYHLHEHWQQVGSANWSGGTVSYQMSGGAFQFKADNGHDDANGNAYIHILDVIGDINGSTVASIST